MSLNSSRAFDHPHEVASLPLNASYLILATLICLIAYAPDRYLGTRARPDLPGPRGWPLIGNSFDAFFNRKRMLMRIHELGVVYGELFSLTIPIWGRSITINHPNWLEHIKKGALHPNQVVVVNELTHVTLVDTVRYGKGPAALAIFTEFPGKRSAFGSEGAIWRWARKVAQ